MQVLLRLYHILVIGVGFGGFFGSKDPRSKSSAGSLSRELFGAAVHLVLHGFSAV